MDLSEVGISNPIEHWYYAHKYRSILKLLSADILNSKTLVDVGAGSALFSLAILQNYVHLNCQAIDTGYNFKELHNQSYRISYFNSGDGRVGDLYLFTDVLEHVLDDVSLLGSYVNTAPIGARFVVTVPALMTLWSGHDVFLKHFRRYKKSELEDCITSSGLEVIKSNYLYTPLFLPIWIRRKLPLSKKIEGQLRDYGYFLNQFLIFLLKFDYMFGKIFPFGVSVIVLAEKQDSLDSRRTLE